MRNLFQGGQCNPGSIEANQNQFKRMMDSMMMGNQNSDKVMDFMNQGVNVEN
jgi:hypothetical protein